MVTFCLLYLVNQPYIQSQYQLIQALLGKITASLLCITVERTGNTIVLGVYVRQNHSVHEGRLVEAFLHSAVERLPNYVLKWEVMYIPEDVFHGGEFGHQAREYLFFRAPQFYWRKGEVQ